MSAWYDQDVADRVRAMEFYAKQDDDCARYWDGKEGIHAQYQHSRHMVQAARCRALAAEMRRTGKVLA